MDISKIKEDSVVDADIREILKKLGKKIFKLQGKNILIAGASGMLGRYITLTLIYANKKIFIKPAHLYLVIRNRKEVFGKDKNIHYINADISNPLPKLQDINYIIHAASKAAPKIYINNKIDTLNTNILGLYNLLGLVTKKLQSFLYLSSGEVYGNPPSGEKINEEYVGRVDNLNERSCYTEGKRACETICMNYFWEKGLPVKIARIFHTFGPGLNLGDGRIFSDFVKNGLEKQNITIRGDKTIKRPILYLKDAAIMFFLLLLSGKNGEVYNIASPDIISVGEFADIVCKAFNKYYDKKISVEVKKDKESQYFKYAVKTQRVDISKFKKDFGYIPETTVEEAVAKTVAFYLK